MDWFGGGIAFPSIRKAMTSFLHSGAHATLVVYDTVIESMSGRCSEVSGVEGIDVKSAFQVGRGMDEALIGGAGRTSVRGEGADPNVVLPGETVVLLDERPLHEGTWRSVMGGLALRGGFAGESTVRDRGLLFIS